MKQSTIKRLLSSALTFGFALIVSAFTFTIATARSNGNVPRHQPTIPLSCFTSLDGLTTAYSTTDASAVQQAIDAAAPSATIRIAGTCLGVQQRSGLTQTAYISKPLALRGGYLSSNWIASNPLSNPTSLDANGLGRVIYATTNITLADLIIKNGRSNANGGGAYIGSSANIFGGSFAQNVASQTVGSGGGLWVSATLQLSGTQFLSNTAYNGGGVYANGASTLINAQFISQTAFGSGGAFGGAFFALRETTIISSLFKHNSGGQAAGVYASQNLTLTNSIFIDNFGTIDGVASMSSGSAHITGGRFENNSTWVGGGLYISNGSSTISGTRFIRNMALYDGGGIHSYPPITIVNALFLSNTVSQPNGLGGGVYAASELNVSSTQFISNSAVNGGAIAHDNLYNKSARIVNSIFALNRATAKGADLYLNSGARVVVLHDTLADATMNPGQAIAIFSGTVNISDTIITSHAVAISQTFGSVSQDYNLFFNNTNPVSGTVAGGTHNITADPLFVDPVVNDYHIALGSPAIDQGMNAGVTIDFDGHPRPQNGGPDIGAYETGYYTLTIAKTGAGSGVLTPIVGVYTYTYGTIVTPTATANTGSTFSSWSGDCSGLGTCALTMTTTKSITATFTLNSYTLAVAKTGTGSGVVTPTIGVYTYTYGTIVTPTASANTDSTFTGWSGACSGTGFCVVTVTTNKSITANFALKIYTLTITSTGTGSGVVTPTVGVYTHTYGTVITITASANLYSLFSGWSGDCSGLGACVVTMIADRTAMASFDQRRIYLPLVLKNF